MRVGIITKIGKNYGAALQAYALKKAFENMGAQSHVIRFEMPSTHKTYKVCKEPWRFRGVIANLCALLHYGENKLSSERFLRFRDERFDFIGSSSNLEELKEQLPACDVCVSGSDQVWNPTISFSPAYYCEFAPEGSRRAAYAASIGIEKIPENVREEFFARVSRFDFISVREKQAQKLLAENGIEAELAPDPTLLFDAEQWNGIARETLKGPYILCYFVATPKNIAPLVKKLQEKLGMKVVNLMTSETSAGIGDIKIRDAGPEEFLGLFQNASFVVTSSFHGTVFSIINRKPFLTTLYSQTGSRVVSLLETLGLEKRIISPGERDAEKYLTQEELYDEQTEQRITALRESGKAILKKIMDG